MPPPIDARRLLTRAGLHGAGVTVFEVGVDAALLQVFFALTPEELSAGVLALAPTLLLAAGWWTLFARRWLAPARRVLADLEAGRDVPITAQEEAREALVRFPRRTVVHRSLAMAAIALVLGPTLAAATGLRPGAAATIAGITVAVAFCCNTLRAFLYLDALEPLHELLAAGHDGLRRWARTLRLRLFLGPYLLGGVGVFFVAVYTYLVVGVPVAEFAGAFVYLPPVIALLGVPWGVVLFRASAPILRYAGVERQAPAEAMRAALSLPHVVGLASLAVWTAGALAMAARHLARGALWTETVQIVAGVLAVAAAAVVFHMNWHRRILAPGVEAIARALGERFEPRRGPLGLFGRLLYPPLALVVFGGTFSFLAVVNEHEQLLASEATRAAELRAARLQDGLASETTPDGLCRRLGRALVEAGGPAVGLDPAADAPARRLGLLAALGALPERAFVAKDGAVVCSTGPVELPPSAREAVRWQATGSLAVGEGDAALAWRPASGGAVVGVLHPWGGLGGGFQGLPALVFVFGALALVCLGLVWLLAYDVAVPLRSLAAAAKRIGSGDLATPVALAGDDEVGELSHAVERMRGALGAKLAELEELNRSLEARVRARTTDLESANRQVTDALKAVAQAQDQIVAQEKLASLGRLVAGIAHEINNPLNFVTNGLPPIRKSVVDLREVLAALDACAGKTGPALEAAVAAALAAKREREIEDLDADDLLRVMQTGVSRMAGVVRALRDFSRADRPEEPPQPFELGRLLDDSLALLRHELAGVTVRRDEAFTGVLRGRAGPLGQVLVNLVKNAAQAAGDGGTITLATRKVQRGVELDVADDGPGIAPDVLPKIFEPFFTTKPVGEGTGLGLSIVHGIVEREGGRVRVRTAPGEGTCFTIFLPC